MGWRFFALDNHGLSRTQTSEVTYTTLEYLTLLTTYSPYLELEPHTREALFDGLQALIDQDFDGQLQLSYVSAFHIGQKV